MSAISAADLGMAAIEGITYSPCTSYLQAANLTVQPKLPASAVSDSGSGQLQRCTFIALLEACKPYLQQYCTGTLLQAFQSKEASKGRQS